MVAYSAFINKEIEDKAIRAGFDLVIESPLTLKILRDKIVVKSIERKAIQSQSQI